MVKTEPPVQDAGNCTCHGWGVAWDVRHSREEGGSVVLLDVDDEETRRLVVQYVAELGVPGDELRVTTSRATFESWLGRRVGGGIGGAYVFLARQTSHAIFINLARIDRSRPRSLEIVVAEELIHMQDHLRGDRRRHAKHGHDRIAYRVSEVTGATLEEIRSCLIPRAARPYRYVYACPTCNARVARKVRGTWSCGRCAPRFLRRHQLRLVEVLNDVESEAEQPRRADTV